MAVVFWLSYVRVPGGEELHKFVIHKEVKIKL